MIGQMAIAVAFPGFNDLGRTVSTILLLMDHFLYRSSAFSENLSTRLEGIIVVVFIMLD